MRKIFLHRKLKILYFSIIIVVAVSVSAQRIFAVWSGTFYNPGDTLNPECLPTDSECDVLIFPSQTGNSGKYLTTDGTSTSWSSVAGGLADIVDDTTPQLGGDLDLNGNVITGMVIGTNIQAYDADLTTYAGITPSSNVQTLLGSADYSAFRTSLGVAIGSDVQAYNSKLANFVSSNLALASNTFSASSGAITITPASGSNLNISLATTGDFAVNTDDLYVDTSTGYVGIGNTSPTGKLVLSSTSAQNFIMEDTDDSKAITQFSGSSGGGWIYTNDAPLRWFTASYADRNTTGSGWTEVMRLSNTGSLGINTSGPDRKLDVLDTSAAQLRLTYTDGSVYTDFQTDNSGYFYMTPTGSNAVLTNTLNIVGSTTAGRGIVLWNTLGSTNLLNLYYDSTYGAMLKAPSGGTQRINVLLTTASTADRDFRVLNSSFTEYFVVKGDGNVGVGTGSPTAKLDITHSLTGSDASSTLVVLPTWNTTGTPTAFKINVTDTSSSISSYLADFQVGGSTKFNVRKNGNVGIGTAADSTKNLTILADANDEGLLIKNGSNTIFNLSAENGQTARFNMYNNGTEVFRVFPGNGSWINISGINFGVGTTGPDRKLDVLDTSAAQLRLTYTDGSVYTDFQTDSSGYLNITPSGSRIKFGTQVTFIGTGSRAEFSTAGGANTNQFKFSTDSALTATSGAANHIDTVASFTPTSGTATFTQFLVSHTINQTGGANGITRGIYINPTLTSAADYRALEIGNSSGYSIYQSGASATNYFAGSIGVGTTSPNQSGGAKALTIASTGSNAALEIWMNKDTITDDTTSGILSFIAGSSSPRRVAEIAAKVRGTNEDTADITFTTMNGGTVGEKMRLLANGNFGIGTDSPDTRLSVASSGANGIHLDIDAGNTSNSGRLFFENSSTTFSIFNSASLLTFGYGASPGGSSGNGALFINTSGKVGVGVSPRKKLDVLDSSDVQLRLTHTDNSVYTDFQTNSSGNLVISPTGGYVGIGTTPLHPLHITSSITQPNSSDVYSAYFKRTYTNNDASTGTRKFGLRVENTYAGTQAYTNASGINNEQAVTNTSTSSQYVGFNSLIEFSGSAAASSITGYSSNLKPLNTVTNAIGFDSFLVGAGTTTNAKLFNAYLSSNSGTITNTYGFYVGDITTGTQTNTPYSFYASDTAARNYFAGDTGFGSATSPSEYIHIKDIASNATPYIYIEGADGGNAGAGLYSTGGAGGAQAGFSLKWSRGSANDIDNNDTFGTYLTTTTNTNLFLGTAGRGRIKIDYDGDTTFFGTNGTTVSMFFDAGSGFLGIGDSSPDYKLDVEGDAPTSYIANFFNDGNDDNRYGIVIQAGADSPSAGRWIQFNDGDGGDVGTVSLVTGTLTLTTTSDERLKENIEDTEIGLDNLRAIQVRDFSFKADGTHRTVHGFIAQELYEAYPDAVITSEDPDKYWQVSYTHLTPLIVKSIQELDVTLSGIENLEEATTFIARLREWLGSIENGISQIYASIMKSERVETQELCIDDLCITKDQLQQIIDNQGSGTMYIYSSGGESSNDDTGGDNTSGDSNDSGDDTSDTGDTSDSGSGDEGADDAGSGDSSTDDSSDGSSGLSSDESSDGDSGSGGDTDSFPDGDSGDSLSGGEVDSGQPDSGGSEA